MPNFPKPKFQFEYSPQPEIQRLRQHKQARAIPAKSPQTLLLATWNIANLGGQERRAKDRQLIAEILSWFDITAIQETKDNFGDLMDLEQQLGGNYTVLMSDPGGNSERMAFVYDSQKLKLSEKVGEVAVPPKDLPKIKLPGVTRKFDGFDRNPYVATWQVRQTSLLLANVHLFFGSEKKADIDRRRLETFAVARWAALREQSPFAFTRNIVALGDFNMPKAEPGDPIYQALTAKGLELPGHSSKVASAVVSDAQYDQIAFFPGATKQSFTGNKGVFDFDQVVFPTLWQQSQANFKTYIKYYLSDHRPMWAEFAV